ncbi:MAG TPA: CocE/NonD family hydrolase [Dehalococcoidia bacterium]|nr:CocE/NonD family hydrolase [Dehalococcoidia bacterium]
MPDETPYASFTLHSDFMMPMRDGVRLATDLYLPDGATEPLPTLLTRTPYSKSRVPAAGRTGDADFGAYFAKRGYAVVVQDVRGRYASEGEWGFLGHDAEDGVDTCAWIGAQTWSNGKVGMWGTSYAGGTQYAIAMAGAPELLTIIPVDAVSNMGYQGVRNAGAFELRFWNWVFTGGNDVSWKGKPDSTDALREMSEHRRHYLVNLPTRPGTTPLKHAPEYERWIVEAMERGCNDEFWAQNSIIDHPERFKDIPVYLVGGWYDSWAGNTSANYRVLSKRLTSDVYLIMGPWIHGQQAMSTHGQVDFGAEAAIADQLDWRRQWFDRWLKGIETAVGREAPFATPVRIFIMGTGDGRKTSEGLLFHGGYWRDEQEWPLARRVETPFYLHEDGSLSTTSPSEADSSTSFDFDPRDPVPSVGGNVSSADGILLQGAYDQRGGPHIWNGTAPIPLSARRDVLVFQTEPLAEDLEVTGEIEVKLWASSSAVDTDFTAKLIDVYPASADFPGGFDLMLEDGIIRGRFRESLTYEKPMTPGEVYEFTIKLYPTSNVFKAGHRIRVDISSSNFPRFDVNPNTGEPLNRHRRMAIATNTVYHDASRPSHIVLPVIPLTP